MDNLIDMIEDGCIRTAIRMVKENWNDPEVVGLIEHTVTDELDVSTTPLLATLHLLNPYVTTLSPDEIELALLLIETNHSNAEHAGYLHYLERDAEDEEYMCVSKTALILAVEKNCPEIISALIQSGQANVEYVDQLGMNALMIAAVHNNIDAAKQIIDATTPSYWRYQNMRYYQTAGGFNQEVKQLIREKKKEILNNNIQADRIGKNARLPLEIIAEIKTNLNNGSIQSNFAKIQMRAQKTTTL